MYIIPFASHTNDSLLVIGVFYMHITSKVRDIRQCAGDRNSKVQSISTLYYYS
jgi:hypothetical protein